MRFQRLHQNGVSGREAAEPASELILPLQPMEKIVAVAKTMIAATIAASLLGAVAPQAIAQNSAPAAAGPVKSRPRPNTPARNTLEVKVINWRNADLVELEAAESGSANWKKAVGALKAGQWTRAKLPLGRDCRVDLRGKYADGQLADASNVEICADKTVNLTN
jgi:hypothetical protein